MRPTAVLSFTHEVLLWLNVNVPHAGRPTGQTLPRSSTDDLQPDQELFDRVRLRETLDRPRLVVNLWGQDDVPDTAQ